MKLVVLLFAVCACAERPAAPAERRVVSLHDVTTELVVALGATDRLVGIAAPVDLDDATIGAVAGVPRVDGLEAILALRPSVVLGTAVVAAQDPALVARLREAGVEVFLGDPAGLEDVFGLADAVAARLGVDGAPLATQLRARAAAITPASGSPVPVFVYDCCDPPFTTGGGTVLNDLIARAGGANVFADLDADWTHVSWEAVVARRPALIVVDAYRYEGQGDVDAKLRAVHAIPSLATVPTVVLPLGEALGGVRSVDGLARLRAAIGGG
ncbi:MAG: helical backbone metal receptor [Deltaproteobacteria bacterium]|nr:helical backbone metal receptor [Deltaproteobacteria bacterium]